MTDKERISELKNLVDDLCDNIQILTDGCEACSLMRDGYCYKEALYEKVNTESEDY